MSELTPIFDQLKLLADQHVPPELLTKAVPAAVICLVLGVGLSVFGAKLSRFGLSVAFVMLGAAAGLYFGRELGYPALLCALVGAAMIGAIGHMTFRLWVGVATAVVFSAFAMGAFSYHRVIPHVAEFQESRESMVTWSPVEGPRVFAVPSPEEQRAYLAHSPGEWVESLWNHVTLIDAHAERHGKALALVAFVAGLCIGVLAVRWMLILTTSLVGTALMTTSVATLIARLMPSSYQSFGENPGVVGIGVGVFLATSLIVQALLTRKAPPASKPVAES